ncbi:unnamed protein product [Protopolystoma xenopodis]|uniref:Uncharacterized protein n=1 Tax=Protopolystoma xenopodis TaxID=117903 RepID=A0A3S5CLB4_9PLAT|nr:unnamed protein product [Protopolystoma xenopodis]
MAELVSLSEEVYSLTREWLSRLPCEKRACLLGFFGPLPDYTSCLVPVPAYLPSGRTHSSGPGTGEPCQPRSLERASEAVGQSGRTNGLPTATTSSLLVGCPATVGSSPVVSCHLPRANTAAPALQVTSALLLRLSRHAATTTVQAPQMRTRGLGPEGADASDETRDLPASRTCEFAPPLANVAANVDVLVGRTEPPSFVWWLVAVLPMEDRCKYGMLALRHSETRMRCLLRALRRLIQTNPPLDICNRANGNGNGDGDGHANEAGGGYASTEGGRATEVEGREDRLYRPGGSETQTYPNVAVVASKPEHFFLFSFFIAPHAMLLLTI